MKKTALIFGLILIGLLLLGCTIETNCGNDFNCFKNKVQYTQPANYSYDGAVNESEFIFAISDEYELIPNQTTIKTGTWECCFEHEENFAAKFNIEFHNVKRKSDSAIVDTKATFFTCKTNQEDGCKFEIELIQNNTNNSTSEQQPNNHTPSTTTAPCTTTKYSVNVFGGSGNSALKNGEYSLEELSGRQLRGALMNNENEDLIGLECLNYLNLTSSKITDLSPITYLENLTVLSFNDNGISDISPISKLTKLRSLGLNNNQIVDITPLQNLSELKELFLEDNNITDISPLSNLSNLERLYLSNNNLEKLDQLNKLKNLKVLTLKNNPGANCDQITIQNVTCID